MARALDTNHNIVLNHNSRIDVSKADEKKLIQEKILDIENSIQSTKESIKKIEQSIKDIEIAIQALKDIAWDKESKKEITHKETI